MAFNADPLDIKWLRIVTVVSVKPATRSGPIAALTGLRLFNKPVANSIAQNDMGSSFSWVLGHPSAFRCIAYLPASIGLSVCLASSNSIRVIGARPIIFFAAFEIGEAILTRPFCVACLMCIWHSFVEVAITNLSLAQLANLSHAGMHIILTGQVNQYL